MTTASHYVIKDIVEAKEDKDNFLAVFTKFAERYSEDHEFLAIFNEYKESEDIDSACTKLEEMSKLRKIEESGGGTHLPGKDRRSMHD